MDAVAGSKSSFRIFLEMIKIEHSIFALPFAFLGMFMAAASKGNLWPDAPTFLLIVVAMVSCRSAAMTYNRIADRDIDALNDRTKIRAIPAGLLSLRRANLYFYASVAIFVVAAYLLNPLAFALSPIALLVTLGYSLCKRFTWLCHYVLGFGLGIAPAAAWIAVKGSLDPKILPFTFSVMFWTAGFDIIYAMQDGHFDRENGLKSIPSKFGNSTALWISRFSHLISASLLVLGGILFGCGPVFFVGCAVAAEMLVYEQMLVKPNDLSKVNLAFFTLNGYVSISFFVFFFIDKLLSNK